MNIKKNHSFLLLTTLLFIFLESSYVSNPHFFKVLDDKITSIYLVTKENKPASPYITIVDIDAHSINMLGQWPFPRDMIAEALINLTNAGTGIIGFDMVFANPDRLSPHRIAQRINVDGNFSNNDLLFAQTLAQTPVILGYFFDMAKERNSSEPKHLATIKLENSQESLHFNKAKSVVDNISILKSSAYSSGFFNLTNITSGVVDSAPILIAYQNKLYPSLATEMLRISSGISDINVLNSDLGVVGIQMGDFNIPSSNNTEIKLNFRGKGFSYKYISFYDILTNNFNQKDVQGKFILIGTSDIGLNDLVTTLYDPAMPGVEVHATTIDNILNSDFFYTPQDSYIYGIALIFLSTIILAFFLYYFSASYSFLIFLVFLSMVLGINYYLIFSLHIIIGLSATLIGLFLTTGLFALLSYYYENIQKKKIFNKLSSKVSKNVAHELLKHDKDILNVEKKDVSILFSDIRGFTSLSEQIKDPEILIKILNRYMSPMVDSITEYNGTVDKFIGDAIMAYWNAPLTVENHADMAVQSALQQLEKLKLLNIALKEEFAIELKIGIGINSGEVIVGEMGSTGRSDYTLIGDTVNLASRVESLTKKYECALLITEQTKILLKGTYILEKVDSLRVKGKQEATTIYRVNNH